MTVAAAAVYWRIRRSFPYAWTYWTVMHQARSEPGIGKLALWIGLFVLVGIPLVAYIWETLNQVMAGYFDPVRLALTVPALLVFAVLLRVMSRWARQWEAQRAD